MTGGKSRQALRKQQDAEKLCAKIRPRKYKATLILAPAQGLGVWKEERKLSFPGLTLRQFYGSATKGSFGDRIDILGTSVLDLLTYLEELPDEPSAASVVILSSYATWSRRSMFWDGELIAAKANAMLKKIRKTRAMDNAEDNIEEDERELTEEDLNQVHSHCVGVFGNVIADEAQKLKSVRTVTHVPVSQLQARFYLLLTATPMINLPMDLHGLLSLLWKPEWADAPEAPFAPTQEHYMEANEELNKEANAATINRHLWLLNPDIFRKWATVVEDASIPIGLSPFSHPDSVRIADPRV